MSDPKTRSRSNSTTIGSIKKNLFSGTPLTIFIAISIIIIIILIAIGAGVGGGLFYFLKPKPKSTKEVTGDSTGANMATVITG